MKRFLNILALALAVGSVHAELTPTPLTGDARLVTFDFDPDNTYLVLTKPRAVTHLEFPEGERVQTLAAGDTHNWEITATKDRKHIFIKAKIENSTTTMTVISEKRSYQFVIKATGDGSKWYQRVTWRVPQTLLLDSEAEEQRPKSQDTHTANNSEIPGIRPEDLRFNYQIEGSAPFKPTSVFDNGKMTWIRMPAGLQELPVVFGLDESGDYLLVNYVPQGDYLVVQRVLEKMVLKVGKTQVTVTKQPRQTSWFSFGGATNSVQRQYGDN